jgi:hypothetical protein
MNTPCCPTCGKPTTLYAWRNLPPQKESAAYRKRIKNLVAQFQLEGYDTYERDLAVAVACAQLRAIRADDTTHLESIIATHMERIIAAQYLETA